MNCSFDLLCSMSPKFTKFVKPKKLPTKLALKEHFRRSSILSVNSKKPDESIISISSATSSDSTSTKSVIISDSDRSGKSVDKAPVQASNSSYRMSKEKYGDIKAWLNTVEVAKKSNFLLRSPPIPSGKVNASKEVEKKIAFNSTFLQSSSKRFDELLSKYDGNFEAHFSKLTIVDDSLDLIDDSCEKRLIDKGKEQQNVSSEKKLEDERKQKENCADVDYDDVENVLDDLYGKSWRQQKDDILPSSEPRVKKKNDTNRICQAPATEKPKQKNLTPLQLNTFDNIRAKYHKKPTESPWSQILRNLCDKESDSEDENLIKTRLNFDEPNEDQVKSKKVTMSTKTDVKAVNQLGSRMLLPSKVKIDNPKVNSTKSVKSTNDKVSKVIPNASFLASLSGSVPVTRCDIKALIFRTNFKQHKVELSRQLFDLFNEKVFDNSIPNNTVLEWNDKMRRTAGFCRCKKKIKRTADVERYVQIDLSTKVLDSADRLRDTLIHEMCHAATWIVNRVSDGHGDFWRAWADRALKVFPELPPISKCHSYVINTKYTYRCQGCGYSVGRHTKSLDVDRKCCGYCRGRFEILINKTTKNGETKTMPATPKKTTGFALFVKDNYANFRTPELKHGEVMKLLGQKFAEMKT